MPVGRPPKPTSQHIADGTYRPDRHADAAANEPQLSELTRLPRPPHFLGDVGRCEWRRVGQELLDKRVLTMADLAAFAGYCASLDRAFTAEKSLQYHLMLDPADGYTVETPQGFRQPRPEVAIARQAWAEVRKFGQEFGITPSSRTRVRAVPKPDEKKTDDPLAFLLGQ